MRIFALLTILWLFSNGWELQAQVFPGINDSVYWVLPTFRADIPYKTEELFIDDETIELDGLDWTKIRRSHQYEDWVDTNSYPPIDTILVGYYRVNDDQVFFRNTFLQEPLLEQGLIYDFSLNEGDSMYALSPNDITDSVVLYRVLEVDTFECGDETRKRMHVMFHWEDPGGDIFNDIIYNTYWIEGIGDIMHPFIPTTCLGPICEIQYLLSSELFINGDSLNLGDEYPCYTLSSITNIASFKNLAPPYPNPIKKGRELNIDVPAGVVHLLIYDYMGRLYDEQLISGIGGEIPISTAELSKGGYCLSLVYEQSIIKQWMLVVN